jgi:hypothetical protein
VTENSPYDSPYNLKAANLQFAPENAFSRGNSMIFEVTAGFFKNLTISMHVYRQDARGIGHADGLDWAPNSVGARRLWRHHVQ